jgi:acyl-CoA synthetase (NDP forming)
MSPCSDSVAALSPCCGECTAAEAAAGGAAVEPATGGAAVEARDLGRLLRPRTIAVVGSARECGRVVEQNRALGFRGSIWPVHPTMTTVAGERAYLGVAELPCVPDAAFVAVPAPRCAPVVAELAAAGCGGAVVYSAGFAEAGPGGVALQRDLLAAAGSMPLLGPNCYGWVNYADQALIWPDQHGGVGLPAGERGVAVVSQSSSIAISVTMADIGLPLHSVVAVGNAAQVGMAQVAEALLASERVSALGLIVESLADLRGWERLAARSRERRIGVVALVLGRSGQARRAVITHTASLAGDAEACAQFLRRNGIGQVGSVDALLAALCLLHCDGPLPGTRLSSLSSSGGEAALIADAAVGRTVCFAELTSGQRAQLRSVLGGRVALANPLDYHTYIWGEPEAMADAFTAMVRGPADLNLLFADLPRADRCADDDWTAAITAFAQACAAADARGALVAAMAGNLAGERAAGWVRQGLAVLAPPAVAMEAIEAAACIGRAWAGPLAPPVAGPRGRGGGATVLNEATGKRLLRQNGLPVPDGAVCASPGAAVVAAADLACPIVVKGLGVAHKTDQDAVRLGLVEPADVRAAAVELLARFPAVLVERLVSDGIAELLVGVQTDPVFGPVLSVGVGGVLTELVRDVAHLVLPVDPAEIRRALLGLRCAPLLTGYRGAPSADLDRLVAVVAQVAELVLDMPELVELEINPLIVTAEGAWACDALVVTSGGRA